MEGLWGQGDPREQGFCWFIWYCSWTLQPLPCLYTAGYEEICSEVSSRVPEATQFLASPGTPPQVLPTQLIVASLRFTAMPSRWPHSPCLLPEGPAGCLGREGNLGECHKAMGSMDPLSLYTKSVLA